VTPPAILLNPGPVTLSERVRRALTRPDLCHREPEFAELVVDIKRRLARVYPGAEGQFSAILLTGSGTCAVEAMLSSLLPFDAKTLILANGVYGERMAAMVEAHGKPTEVLMGDWLMPIDLEDVDRRLATDRSLRRVVAVHNETTTGRLNDLTALAEVCRAHGRALLVDAVSSFGAEAIDFQAPSLEAVAATANKCLHGAPGISFVLARDSLFDRSKTASRTLYLDLFRYRQEQTKGFSPFTTAVHVAFALQEALIELEEEGGWVARRARYSRYSSVIRQTLNQLGVRSLVPDRDGSSMISSFRLPEGLTFEHLHGRLGEAGFVIYAGQGHLAPFAFRIANMGHIPECEIARLLNVLKDVFRSVS
jgi:2-aminoethylphosphonate-pyruvate transaminase